MGIKWQTFFKVWYNSYLLPGLQYSILLTFLEGFDINLRRWFRLQLLLPINRPTTVIMSSRSSSVSSMSDVDMDHQPPVVLVLGHSYMSRLNNYISGDPARENLALEKSSVLAFAHDVGTDNHPGGVFAASSQLDLVWELSPDSVVIDLGSNDLCSSKTTTEEVVHSIVDLALRVSRIPGVRHVLVCSITPRLFMKPDFNHKVSKANRLLSNTLEGMSNVHFWQHRSMTKNHTRLFTHDGFHFNDTGMLRYYRSIRGAVMKAYKLD